MSAMSYELRPSKAVTRRIFVDMLRRLTPISPLNKYQYVGFGALEFVDFDLIHRHLGIADMISIESDPQGISRYEWNRPFNSIVVISGKATSVLPSLDWSRLSIVWLDYTDTLNSEVLQDLETLARVLIPGSVLAVTVNAHPSPVLEERRNLLEKAITADRIPIGVTNSRLGDWGLAETQHKVMDASLRSAFEHRTDAADWRQVLNICYKDSARMQMVVGIISAPASKAIIDLCRLSEMREYNADGNPLLVHVPLLTAAEKEWLNRRLPLKPGEAQPALADIKASDIASYEAVYRWLQPAG